MIKLNIYAVKFGNRFEPELIRDIENECKIIYKDLGIPYVGYTSASDPDFYIYDTFIFSDNELNFIKGVVSKHKDLKYLNFNLRFTDSDEIVWL